MGELVATVAGLTAIAVLLIVIGAGIINDFRGRRR